MAKELDLELEKVHEQEQERWLNNFLWIVCCKEGVRGKDKRDDDLYASI
ncbi:uncharacterized protein G2W53_029950 [Senna tora]|uniref:Uncharacterized protein n=1 Tax=Senna tora TaxID=362788 RepID=A0A834T6L0_9FABA|nr:uncharacterized protein G2W53_029950 [Senna tora]